MWIGRPLSYADCFREPEGKLFQPFMKEVVLVGTTSLLEPASARSTVSWNRSFKEHPETKSSAQR